ncbi:MAG TPA: metalloregulator ArsR/SmtB family transcription factor [Balneolales bacterium]|nr:metalloregulator ArsR/SmtB family transcription factor [Balneolales bacterium]
MDITQKEKEHNRSKNITCEIPGNQLKSNADRFKALSNPTRLKILSAIAKYNNSVCGCDFEQLVDIKQPTISHHIKILMDEGLVQSYKESTWVYYRINPEIVLELMKELKKLIA